jgi:hypothetical protein
LNRHNAEFVSNKIKTDYRLYQYIYGKNVNLEKALLIPASPVPVLDGVFLPVEGAFPSVPHQITHDRGDQGRGGAPLVLACAKAGYSYDWLYPDHSITNTVNPRLVWGEMAQYGQQDLYHGFDHMLVIDHDR